MSDATFDQHDQTVSQQTNVAGDAVGRDKVAIIGNGNVGITTLSLLFNSLPMACAICLQLTPHIFTQKAVKRRRVRE